MKTASTKAVLLLLALLLLAACGPTPTPTVVVGDGTADYSFKTNVSEQIDAYCLKPARVVCFVHRNYIAPTMSCIPYNDIAGGFTFDINAEDVNDLLQTPTICGDE